MRTLKGRVMTRAAQRGDSVMSLRPARRSAPIVIVLRGEDDPGGVCDTNVGVREAERGVVVIWL